MEGEIVYAIHNFDASVEDEISLEAGEAILVIEKDDLYNDGWWQGKNSRGEIGLFPMNFISSVNPHATQGLGDRYANLLKNPEAVEVESQSEKDSLSPVEGEFVQSSKAMGDRLSDPPFEAKEINNYSSSSQKNSKEGTSLTVDTAPSDSEESSEPDSPVFRPIKNPTSKPTSHPEQAVQRPTSSTPRTPNRSSFRQSVRLSMVDTSDPSLPHPSKWATSQVVDWLNNAGFTSISHLFQENEITGDILIKLDLNTLKDIGVVAFGKRFNLNNAINGLKLKHGIDTPTTKLVPQQSNPSPLSSSLASSDDPPPPSKEVNEPPIDHDLYPLENQTANQLSKKVQALALGRNKADVPAASDPSSPSDTDPHSHVQQWLQGASEYDYDHDSKEGASIPGSNQFSAVGLDSQNDTFANESVSSSIPSQRMPVDSSSYAHSSSPSQIYSSMLKKQVSFSQHNPEVIGVSESSTAFDEPMHSRANERALPPPPKVSNNVIIPPPRDGSSLGQMSPRLDLFPNSDNVATRTYSVEPVENIPAGSNPPISGWLKKQEGAIKLWKLRWCELEGAYLRVWDSNKRKKIKVTIDLRGYKPVLDPNLNPGKYCFKLTHPSAKSHGFSSDEAADIRLWMKALMKVSIDRDISAPVVTSCTVNTVPLHVARKLAPRPPSAMIAGSRDGNDLSSPNHNGAHYI